MSAGGVDRRRRSERRRAGDEPSARDGFLALAHGPGGDPIVLSRRQLEIVNALRAAGVLSVSEIAEALGVSRSVATTRVEEFVRLGVVDRRMDPEDCRRRQVRLTVAWLPDRAAAGGRG